MRKYFCDGCDNEISDFKQFKNLVTINVAKDNTSQVMGDFELCTRCIDRLLADANPRRWVRAMKATQAA